MKKPQTIKQIATLIVVACVIVPLFFKTGGIYEQEGDHLVKISFLQTYWYQLWIGVVLILYSIFRMRTDRFFKKPRKERNFHPLLITAGGCIIIIATWIIDGFIPAVFP